ncbi:MAG: bifunctional oligoribonuclease/PAP phosphatase NrnA [Sphingobacteriaceae bacterium]|nr:bifunctional oligoribonuclease/PAP phosphatase NrnA [Sphingobacteriaceae bacterium]
MLDIQQLKTLLNTPQNIVITTHHKPDGDAMGSSLGLYAYLIQKGHHVKVITPTDYPDFLHWMPYHNEVIIYTEAKEKADDLVQKADLIFCLDFNALSRINELGEVIKTTSAYKIMIDHHLEPEDFDDYRHWNIHACAAAQLVYDFIVNELEDPKGIDKDVATCLYTGIMTDSGSFRFPTATAEVYRIAANLIDSGAEHWRIHQLVYDNTTEDRLKFLGHCLTNNLEVLKDFNTAIISVTAEDLKKYNVMTGDTEGIVNYALSIGGVKLAAFVVERSDKVKLSLRSTGDFPANEICKLYFNGGGHKNAAGGFSDLNLQDTVTYLKTILDKYKTQLLT